MGMRKNKSGIGWLRLSLISTVVVAVTAAVVVLFNLFPVLTDDKQVTKAEQSGAAAEQNPKDVEEVQETVGKAHRHIGEFVSEMHDFYNETTGYGGIEELNWDKQIEQVEKINKTLEEELPEAKNEALQHDLAYVQQVAKATAAEKKKEHVRELHRMFHDLDIALNHYNGYDKIWDVTETLEKAKKPE